MTSAPYEIVEHTFAPLVASRIVRDLTVALIVPGEEIAWYPTNDSRERERRLYEVGSLTKPMTAEVLASMIEDGRSAITIRIGDVIPDLPSDIASITLEELVTHQSRLPRLPPSLMFRLTVPFTSDPYRSLTAARLVRILAKARRTSPAGTYSNFGFGVLGYVLGKSHGLDFANALDTRLLRPLGLANTFLDASDDLEPRFQRVNGSTGVRVKRWHTAAIAPAGGVSMTIVDGATWLAAHIEPPEGFREIVRMVIQPRAPLANYRIGMGWCVVEVDGRSIVWHNGGTGGFSSFAAFDPAGRIGIIAFAASPHVVALDLACFEVVRTCGRQFVG